MNKKSIIIILTVLLIAPIISTQACADNSLNESLLEDLRILTFETQTQVTIDEETIPTERIDPGETKTLEAKVDFKFDLPDLFPKFLLGTKIGNWIIFRDKEFDMSINLSLSVAKKPEWCDVEIPETITINNIGTTLQENTFEFSITVNNSAVGLQTDEIQIQATFTPESSWGLLDSSGIGNFTIESNYVGELEAFLVFAKNTTEIKFEGGETKTLKLRIINHYNAETIVQIETILEDEIFNISIEQQQVTLERGGEIDININITAIESDAYKNQEYRIQTPDIIKLSPKAFEDPTVTGEQITIKSPDLIVEDEGDLMDIIMLVIYATIILIALAVVIILVFKRLNR